MSTDSAFSWDRYTAFYQVAAELPTTTASYGPDIPTEADLRLLGDLRGKRVLELGCGGAQSSVAFAKQGAIAIGVDFSAEQLAYAKQLCEREGVRVDLRHGDVADLAFLQADSVDVVFSAYTFEFVEDLNRVFRQAHRVLRVGAPLVFSVPHPAHAMVDDDADPPLLVRRAYCDRAPIDYELNGIPFTVYHRTISDLYMSLIRASYRVDAIVEPEPLRGAPRSHFWRETFTMVPPTLIIRARKEGN